MHGGWVEASLLSTSPLILLYLLCLLGSGFFGSCFLFVCFYLFYWCDGSMGLPHVPVCVEQFSGVTIPQWVLWVKHVVSLLWQALLSSELSN